MGRSGGFSLYWWPWIFSARSWVLSTLLCSLWDFHVLSVSLGSHSAVLTELSSSSSPGMGDLPERTVSPVCSNHA